jgi:hypothetical protein
MPPPVASPVVRIITGGRRFPAAALIKARSDGLWVMGYGLWVMGYGLWVMGYGLWVMGYGLWVMGDG